MLEKGRVPVRRPCRVLSEIEKVVTPRTKGLLAVLLLGGVVARVAGGNGHAIGRGHGRVAEVRDLAPNLERGE
jgi:hypothetical protein